MEKCKELLSLMPLNQPPVLDMHSSEMGFYTSAYRPLCVAFKETLYNLLHFNISTKIKRCPLDLYTLSSSSLLSYTFLVYSISPTHFPEASKHQGVNEERPLAG